MRYQPQCIFAGDMTHFSGLVGEHMWNIHVKPPSFQGQKRCRFWTSFLLGPSSCGIFTTGSGLHRLDGYRHTVTVSYLVILQRWSRPKWQCRPMPNVACTKCKEPFAQRPALFWSDQKELQQRHLTLQSQGWTNSLCYTTTYYNTQLGRTLLPDAIALYRRNMASLV